MATTPLIWQAAQQTADKVRELHARPDGQVDLEALCESLEIRVTHTDALPAGTSGMLIKKSDDERPRIYINSTESAVRQRFTLAHEIGHYMERITIVKDNDFSFRDERGTKYDLHEFYADQFAGALLMPLKLILRAFPDLINNHDSLTLSLAAFDVADMFNVSYSAAAHRLGRLVKQGELQAAAA
ncbi:ImmA/IrrE family metallo-endopeptidase [Actinomyces glycerinitolerans]|uniref:IrrE N-terminal-like domain-containing protein n=1 Tax=Actinomyces glycerinitolerans TaxID=1892869 RepID=A0A1M4RZ08_9ACTO|nr:ImmA/IrrE family metallo-endopeptidase [Actinomyces glycerinitolerans]SHE25214.1 Hypothetical protein ACGLYG10_1430 [Actinomyces glycerinitolerans]